MSIKKIIKSLFAFTGLLAIGLCSVIAIKMPDVFRNLIGINKDNTTIQSVPYFVNFGDLGNSDSSYKTQYFKYANRSWYLSWGNHRQKKDHIEDDGTTKEHFNMLLGWNDTTKPTYGSYSYVKEVMNEIEVKDNYNYSYLIMDFDFNMNHSLEFSFSSFDNLVNTDTTIYLISSHNNGTFWNVLDSMKSTNLKKGNEQKFAYTEDSLTTRTTRYGMVLVSNALRARIELNQFIVSRLSIA